MARGTTRPPVTGKGLERPARKLPDKGPRRDPEGAAPAGKAAEDEPKGQPNSDRHRMETLIARHPTGRRQ